MREAFYTFFVPLVATAILWKAAELIGVSEFAQGVFAGGGFIVFRIYADDVWAGRAA